MDGQRRALARNEWERLSTRSVVQPNVPLSLLSPYASLCGWIPRGVHLVFKYPNLAKLTFTSCKSLLLILNDPFAWLAAKQWRLRADCRKGRRGEL